MPLSILIADDANMSRRVLKHLISAYLKDIILTEANTGSQVLHIIRSQSIDLLFLDLHMPEVNGIDVLRTLQSEGYKLKIVVCSADFQEETQKRIRSYGASFFINKNQMREQLPIALQTLGIIKNDLLK